MSSTASPSILEDWQRRFKAYFAASRANTAPVNVQQEIFLTFLDATLCKRIKRKLLFDTTVVTNDRDGEEVSALQILIDEFKAIHPSLVRQLQLFRMLQANGQKWTDFFYVWEDAFYTDLEGIDYKSLSVILLISSTTDTDLEEEFQRKDSPTTEQLQQIATRYDENNKDRNFIAGSKDWPAANMATAGKGKPITKINAFFQQLKKEVRCYRCIEKGGEGHKERCTVLTTKCGACQKPGHTTAASTSKHASASVHAATASGGADN